MTDYLSFSLAPLLITVYMIEKQVCQLSNTLAVGGWKSAVGSPQSAVGCGWSGSTELRTQIDHRS